MSVTFGTPVSAAAGAVAISGVSLGQPILLVVEFTGPSNAVADNFAIPYTWTQIDQVSIFSSAQLKTVYKTTFIGTNGYGSSGTISVTGGQWISAVAAIGASGAAGLSAVDVHGVASGNSLTLSSPSLTPSTTGEGAMYSALAVEVGAFVSIASGPGSPWSNTMYAPFAGLNLSAIATYPSPPASALATSWTQTSTGGSPDNNDLSMGVILKAFAATAPSAPTNQLPANASFQDVSGGIFISGIYNPTDNVQSSFQSLRMKLTGGTYGYWNGTDFSSTTQQWFANTTLPGQTFSVFIPNGVAVPGGTFSNAHTFNWSFASEESAGSQRGSFASDFTLVAQAGAVTTISAPANGSTVHGTTQPTITWSSTYPSGATQTAYQIIIESGAFGTSPGSGVVAWNSGVVSSTVLTVLTGVALTPGVPYAVFIQVTETGPEVGAWVRNTFTLQVDTPAAPTITAAATTDGTTGLPEVQLTVQGRDNALTLNQSSFESGTTTGWTATLNCAITASTTKSLDGAFSMRMSSTAAGRMDAGTLSGVSGFPVIPGQTYTGLASFIAGATGRSCFAYLYWFNAAGAALSNIAGTPVTDLTSGWTQASVTAVAPAGAAFAQVVVSVQNPAGASELHYVDQISFAPGSSTIWTVGGFVGTTTVQVLRSDGQYVRTAGWPSLTQLTISPVGQTLVFTDPEAAPGTAYTYTAVISSGALSGVASSASNSVTLNTNGYWWIFDPTQPEAICVRFLMKSNWQPIVLESGSTYKPLGNEFMIKSTDGTKGVGGIVPIYTGDSLVNSQAAEKLVQQVQPLCLMTPTRGIYYVMSDPGTNQRGNITPWWEVDQPQGEWQFYVVQTSRP